MTARNLSFILLANVLFFTSGCETPPDTQLPNLTEAFTVKRGTTAAELVAVLGEPKIKHPVAAYSVDAEIWVYHRTMGTESKSVFTGTEEHKFWDPFRREMIVFEVPVYQPEVSSNVEMTEILMVKDQVYSWKRKSSERRDIDGLSR